MANLGTILGIIESKIKKVTTQLKSDITSITEEVVSSKNIFDDTELKAATGITFEDGEYTGTANSFYNVGQMMQGDFEPNTAYVLSLYAYVEGTVETGNGLCIRVVYTDNTYNTTYIPNSTSEYTRFYVAGSHQNKSVAAIMFLYEAGMNNTWHIKQIQVEKGTEPTEYVDPDSTVLTAVDEVARERIATIQSTVEEVSESVDRIDEEVTEIKAGLEPLTDAVTTTNISVIDKDISDSFVQSKYIKTNVGVGNTVSLSAVDSQYYCYILTECNAGDVFTVKGTGGDSPRAWAFIDANNVLLSCADAYATPSNIDITAPSGAANAIFCADMSAAHKVIKRGVIIEEKTFVKAGVIDKSFVNGNLFDKDTITAKKKYVDGVITDDNDYYLSDFIEIEPNAAYTYRGVNGAINYFDEDKAYISAESITTYDQAVTKQSVTGAKFVRLQMGKRYYPYHNLTMNAGNTGSKVFTYGKLLKEQKIELKKYAFSAMPIPGEYTAYGVKAVDGSAGTDFDNENPSLSDLYDAFDALVTAYPDYVTKEDLGLDQSDTYHIYAYHFVPESMTESSTYYRLPYPKINLLSGIHGSGDGGENCINIYCVYYLMKSICENWTESEALEYMRWNVRFSIVPVQNPYGFVNGTRKNSRGVDLNRNFSIGWVSREQSSAEYGGTAPMSEAESLAIANFLEANKDAMLSIDLHGTGNTSLGQDSLLYCGTDPQDDTYYVIKALITKMSHLWDSQNITTPGSFHGFITGSIEGDGTMRAYMFAEKKMHSMVLEAFVNYTGSPYTKNSQEIMQMNADKLGLCLLYGLSHYKNKE